MSDVVVTDQVPTDDNKYLDQLVGEGKKYATVEDLAKGAVHANQFIDTLKTEKLELEEKLGVRDAQENHLETIVDLLKQPKQEPVKEPEPPKQEPKEEVVTPQPTIDVQLNAHQFAQEAVKKYGDAKVVGKHLQEYIGGDESRQALVTTMMQTDPSALLKILPDTEQSKGFSPTGSAGPTSQPTPYTGMTYSDAMSVKKENPKLFNSPAYTMKMIRARTEAKAAGVNWDET